MSTAYEYTPAPRARRYAIIATVITGVLCVLSQLALNIDNRTLPFLLLPTLAIYMWPSGANPIFSIAGVFAMGMLQDYLSYGPMGLWSVTWLILFLVYRPDLRDKTRSFLWMWIGAFALFVAVWAFQFALAKFVLASSMDLESVLLSVLAGLLMFPPFYFLRQSYARLFGNRDSFYYERPSR